MKNLQKGFIVPLLLGVIALLVIVGGVYYYSHTSSTTKIPDDRENVLPSEDQSPKKQINTSVQTNVDTKTVSVSPSACSDTDGGVDYYVAGTSNFRHGPLGINSDTCFTRNLGSTEARVVAQCSAGQSCFMYELFCSSGDINYKEASCPNGCSSGACIR